MTHTITQTKQVCPNCEHDSFTGVYDECDCCERSSADDYEHGFPDWYICDNCSYCIEEDSEYKTVEYTVEMNEWEYSMYLGRQEVQKKMMNAILFGDPLRQDTPPNGSISNFIKEQ